jgi:hypothetical protein
VYAAATLPASTAEPVVCANGMQNRAEYDAWAAEQARVEPQRRAPATPKPAPPKSRPAKGGKKTDAQLMEEEARRFAELFTSDDNSVAPLTRSDIGSLSTRFEYAPACLYDGDARINGVRVQASGRTSATYKRGTAMFADQRLTCGSVRFVAKLSSREDSKLRVGGGGRGGGGDALRFRAGPLFWPDGTSAGKSVQEVRYFTNEVATVGKLRCVVRSHVDGRVCHRASDLRK